MSTPYYFAPVVAESFGDVILPQLSSRRFRLCIR